MNVLSELGNVNTSIRLTRQVEIVILELRELLIKFRKHSKVVNSSLVVIVDAALIIADGVADTSRVVDPNYVGVLNPCVVVPPESFSLTIVHHKWSIFLE